MDWKEQIMREVERVENLVPAPLWFNGDWPQWVKNLAMELLTCPHS